MLVYGIRLIELSFRLNTSNDDIIYQLLRGF